MVSGLRKLSRLIPIGARVVQNAEVREIATVLLPIVIRLLPLIPSPFLGGKLLLAQRLVRRHKALVPLLVAGHRLVQRSRR
jgi:hypothetical protein